MHSHTPLKWIHCLTLLFFCSCIQCYKLMSVSACSNVSLLVSNHVFKCCWLATVANTQLHCFLGFYLESPLLLAGKLYYSNFCWRCKRGGVVSGARITYCSSAGSNEASSVCGFTSMNLVIQWAEITPLYGEL